MHIVFSRHKLLSALKACQKVIPKSTFRSIFQCALLYSSPTFSGVRIEATDLNSGVSALDESAAVLETGSVVCPIRGVVRFLSNSKSSHVEVRTTDGDNFRVGDFEVQGFSPDDFPQLPVISSSNPVFLVSSNFLSFAISRAKHAAVNDSSQSALNGFYLSQHGSLLRLATTDGKRAVIVQTTVENSLPLPNKGLVVPYEAMLAVATLFEVCPTISLFLEGNQIAFRGRVSTVCARLIEAEFPPLNALNLESLPYTLSIERISLLDTLKLVLPLLSSSYPDLQMELGKNVMRISVSNLTKGSLARDLSCDYDGPDLVFGVDAKYLKEMASGSKDENFTLTLTDDQTPIRVHEVHKVGGEVQNVVELLGLYFRKS